MKAIGSFFLSIFQWAGALGLLLSIACIYINPNTWSLAPFFTLSFAAWVLLSLGLFVFGLFVGGKTKWFNLLVLLLASPYMLRSYGIGNSVVTKGDLKVMSFNTRMLGGNKKNTSKQLNSKLVSEYIDLAVFLEWNKNKGNISTNNFPYQQFVSLKNKKNFYFGLKIVSKYKIVKYKRINLPKTIANLAAYVDIVVKKDTMRVFALHLQSNKFSGKHVAFIKSPHLDEKGKKEAKSLVVRIREASKKRASQALYVKKLIDQSPYPYLIMGDFNDTPQSYTYQKLSENTKDAFLESSTGWEATYLKPWPILRIDYILYSNNFEAVSYTSGSDISSDHKYIISKLNIK